MKPLTVWVPALGEKYNFTLEAFGGWSGLFLINLKTPKLVTVKSIKIWPFKNLRCTLLLLKIKKYFFYKNFKKINKNKFSK